MRRSRSLLPVILGCATVAFIIFNTKTDLEDPSGKGLTRPQDGGNDPLDPDAISRIRAQLTQTSRYVTPSLAELGGRGSVPEMSEHVVMVTRVPGAGVELLVLILQHLQGYNVFKHIRLPPGDDGLLTTLQQELLVEEITGIIRQEAVPLSFDGDVRFLNFSTFGRQAPTFVSMVRDPSDPRITQRFRNGDTGAIAHFCGQDPRCTQRNSSWALGRAKATVSRWYPVVGLLDHIEDSLIAMEQLFPYFFSGAMRVYSKLRVEKKSDYNKNAFLKPLAKRRLGEVLAKEVEFYQWLKHRLLNTTSGNG